MATYPTYTTISTFGGRANTISYPTNFIPRIVRFWLLLIFLIPSLMCSFILLYHSLFDRTLRTTLSNHFIIVLLFNALLLQFIDIPLNLNFDRVGSIQP
jgi:hypothetical protein